MVDHILNWTIYRKLFTSYLILLKIAKSILAYWKKSLIKKQQHMFFNTIESCNNLSTLGLDKLSWRYLKEIVKNKKCTNRLINIANTCIDLGYWPSHFKTSSIVIIPKSNKASYDLLKLFWPIVLLNTISKLFKKIIGERIQFSSISNNFIHPC